MKLFENMTLHDSHRIMFERYLEILKEHGEDQTVYLPNKTSNKHLKWMCEQMIENLSSHEYPIDKAARWLGFVQGVMIMKKHITVDEERNFSRPLFSPFYKNDEKSFRDQFVECRENGTSFDGPFLSFEQHPENLPLFPNQKMKDAILSGEWKGITLLHCKMFGGVCSSGNEGCRKMRGVEVTSEV
jgi:hypothetical protein